MASLDPSSWTWLQTDLGLYLSTLATAALTFIAIVLAVVTTLDSERRATRQSLVLWGSQLSARRTRLQEREAQLQRDQDLNEAQAYLEGFALWGAFEKWAPERNIIQPPPSSIREKQGDRLEVLLSLTEDASADSLPAGFEDFALNWNWALRPFLEECRAAALGIPGHEESRKDSRLVLRAAFAEGRTQTELQEDFKQVAAEHAELTAEVAALELMRMNLSARPQPLVALGLLALGCVAVPLVLMLFEVPGVRAKNVLVLASFLSLLIAGALMVRWLRPHDA